MKSAEVQFHLRRSSGHQGPTLTSKHGEQPLTICAISTRLGTPKRHTPHPKLRYPTHKRHAPRQRHASHKQKERPSTGRSFDAHESKRTNAHSQTHTQKLNRSSHKKRLRRGTHVGTIPANHHRRTTRPTTLSEAEKPQRLTTRTGQLETSKVSAAHQRTALLKSGDERIRTSGPRNADNSLAGSPNRPLWHVSSI